MFAAQPLLDSSASPLEILALALHQRAERLRRLTAAVRADDRDAALAAAKSVERGRVAVDEAWAVVRAGLPPPPEAVGLLRELLMQVERADLDLREALQAGKAKDLDAWLQARAPFEPAATVDAMLRDGEFEPLRDLVLAVGPRCGAVIEELARRGQRRVLWLASAGAPLADDLGETQVLRAKDAEAVEESTWSVVNPAPASVRCVAPPGTDRALIDEGMRRALEVLRLRAVFEAFAKRYGMDLVRRGLRNARHVASLPNAGALTDALRGEAAVIVAAGPSLDKNIHLLKGMQGKVAILAMNQTVRALRRAGIRPDVVLAGDWGNLTPHFEGVEPGEIGALGLATVVTPALFDVPADRRFVFAASPWIERWLFDMLGEDATLHARGSVSFSLLELALRMGCSTVAFIGLDLAFEGTRYYARGAADGEGELETRGDGTVSMRTMASTKMKLAASGRRRTSGASSTRSTACRRCPDGTAARCRPWPTCTPSSWRCAPTCATPRGAPGS
ncbi:MAG: 6-hydroxymethylpterin diphosphokinase MptE-like protein [Polyangiales bacterium]